MKKGLLTAFLAAGLLFAGVLSCDKNPAGGESKPPERTPAITSAQLVSGGEGVLVGAALDLLPASITVDGQNVVPTARTAEEIRFRMPPGRSCETDGRLVTIRAENLTHSAPLTVPSVLRMEVGESRVLSREQLASACIQLPAGEQSFVMSVLNPSLADTRVAVPMFTVRTWTAAGGMPTMFTIGSATRAPAPREPRRAVYDVTPGSDFYSENPEPFDPAYATAMPGDTVRWVDYDSPEWYGNGNICRAPKSSVPTFGAVVLAVSSSGRTVIAVDERTRYWAEWTSDASRARLARLAEIAERWTLPAIREVFGADYQPVRGGGGRTWHVFRTGIARHTVDLAGMPQSMCRWFSEVANSLGPDVPLMYDAQVPVVAGYLIHEYGHHAEDVFAVRRWGNVFGRGPSGWDDVFEAWAQTVQETATRLASNQPTGARHELADGPDIPSTDFYHTGYGERPDQSPWAWDRGPYEQGTRLLMYLREQWGDAALGSARERFYSRVTGLESYDFQSMARLVGLDPVTALDRWSLAEATDDLVDPAAVAARELPQLRTWVPDDPGPLRRVSRTADGLHALGVASGSYAALYFLADAMPGPGVSLTFSEFGTAPFIARITRLR
jgi:hypothetical protein